MFLLAIASILALDCPPTMQSDQLTIDFESQALFEAARTGHLSVCQALLEQWREHRLSSPLTSRDLAPSLATAISSKHLHVVAFLLEQGAAISGNDMILALGETDASLAMFQTFLDHGWDVNSETDIGNVMLKCVPLFCLSSLTYWHQLLESFMPILGQCLQFPGMFSAMKG